MTKLFTEKDLDKFLLLGYSPVLFMPDIGSVYFQLREGLIYKKGVSSLHWVRESTPPKVLFKHILEHGIRVRALSPPLFEESE